MHWHDVLLALVTVGAILLYFTRLSGLFDDVLFGRLQRTARLASRPVAQIHSVAALCSACLSQTVLVIGLSAFMGSGLLERLVADVAPQQILFGVLLGLGEMAIASFLINILIRAIALVSATDAETELFAWLRLIRGGWLRLFLDLRAALPGPAAHAIILYYIAMEETLFRGVLVQALIAFGEFATVLVAVLLFIVCQFFGMPSWRHGLFPAGGALVVGLIHTRLILDVASILPLIVAHYVFFIVSARHKDKPQSTPLLIPVEP